MICFKELGLNKFFIVYLMCHQKKKSFRGQNWSFCWYNLQKISKDILSFSKRLHRWNGYPTHRWMKHKQYNPKKHQRITWQCEVCVNGSCYNTVTYIDIKTSDLAFCGQSKGTFEHLIKTLDKDCYTFFWQVYNSTFNLVFHLIKEPLQHRYSSINLEKISKQKQKRW